MQAITACSSAWFPTLWNNVQKLKNQQFVLQKYTVLTTMSHRKRDSTSISHTNLETLIGVHRQSPNDVDACNRVITEYAAAACIR